jgi:hypothetical protein
MKSMTSDVLVNSDIKLDVGSRCSTPVEKDALSVLNEIEILENEARAKIPEVPTAIVNSRSTSGALHKKEGCRRAH